MSGWIKMGTGLGSHPKVKTMRRALKADRLRVIGGLWAVWCVFDEHSASGRLDGYTLDDMDEEIGWKGFSAAMADIGWLIADDGGLEAPDYEQHNGPNAKRRALDASRKGQARAKGSADEPDEDPPEKRTPVRNVSASDADKTRNREEKRREELIHPEAKASAAAAAPLGLIATGIAVPGLPRSLSLAAYVQAGWVGGPGRTAYAEGVVRLDRARGASADAGPRVGLGLWVAGQRGVQRLDAGPAVTIPLPDSAGMALRLEASWRQRLAGNAAPGSGPAILLAASF